MQMLHQHTKKMWKTQRNELQAKLSHLYQL
jgi:hypothetical protein